MVRHPNPETDQISRSILQKAVRRGDKELTGKLVAYLAQKDDFEWMRKRLAVITFEECWTYALELTFESNIDVVNNHLLKLASAVKNKNAAGLGSLGYELSKGDFSTLDGSSSDRAIKVMAEAVKRPNDFWKWIHKKASDNKQRTMVSNAHRGFNRAGWLWDKAFAQAAAYLALTEDIPDTVFVEEEKNYNLPLWVGIDKHTSEGKIVISSVAKEFNVDVDVALWLSFYFEGAICNQCVKDSRWWYREIEWRMKKLNVNQEKGERIWQSLRPIIQERLSNETKKIEDNLFSIKTIPKVKLSNQMKIF